ncbi:MAG: tetratricopeptide repeat protein [Planctomycetota bacterium]
MADQDQPVRRRVALKIIEAERQALAMMDHPCIARVLDAGETDLGRPYFVMELVRGEPITEYCHRNRLSTRDRLELFAQACHAVQHAHQKGVIHRDIKPNNVLVTVDGKPMPKIIDFGIAKATGARLTDLTLFTEHRALIGTPAYMSPEQADMSAVDIDTRSDIYSLGVLLYELLTGTTPFDTKELMAAGLAEIQRIIREEEPEKPSTRLSTLKETAGDARRGEDPGRLSAIVRGDLDWIVMKALEKDRTRRYETADGLAADVARHLAGEAVLAVPPSSAYRVRKFVRRHRVGVMASSLVVLSLAAGTFGTTIGLVRAERQRGLAETRAGETSQVADFQASMLGGIDVEAMGRGIRSRYREQVKAALEQQLLGEARDLRFRTPEEVEAELSTFDALVNTAQDVDVARGVLGEHVLGLASEALDGEFQDQPLVRARLHTSLGDTYRRLSLFEQAEQHLSAAVAIAEPLEPENPDVFVDAVLAHAWLRHEQGRYQEAADQTDSVVDMVSETYGDESLEVARALGSLSASLRRLDRLDEAETAARRTLAIRRLLEGEDSPNTLGALDNLGTCLSSQGHTVEAQQHLMQAMEGRLRVLGEDHRDTLSSFMHMGDFHEAEGDLPSAEQYYARALEGRRRVFGDDHFLTVDALTALAVVVREQYRLDDARAYALEAVRRGRRWVDDAHPDKWVAMNTLSDILTELHQFTEAERIHRENFELSRRVRGPLNELTLWSAEKLGASLRLQGPERFDQAEEYLLLALEGRKRTLGPTHFDLRTNYTGLAVLSLRRNQMEAAIQYYRDALAVEDAQVVPNLDSYAVTLHHLAQAMRIHGDAEGALPFAQEAIDIYDTLESPNPLEHAYALGVLGRVLLDLGRNEESASYFERAMQILRPRSTGEGETRWDWGTYRPIHTGYMRALEGSGRLQDAIALQRQFVDDCRHVVPPDIRALANALVKLGYQLFRQGEYAESQTLLRESILLYEKGIPTDDQGGLRDYSPWLSHSLIHNARIMLGDALRHEGALLTEADPSAATSNFEEAEALLIGSTQWMIDNAESIPPGYGQVRRGMGGIIGLYEAWETLAPDTGKAEQAARWRAELERDIRRKLDDQPQSFRRYIEMSTLGEVLVARALDPSPDREQGRPDLREAESLLVESAEWLVQNSDQIPEGIRPKRIREALERLVRLYETWDTIAPDSGKAEQAARWQAELEKLPRP